MFVPDGTIGRRSYPSLLDIRYCLVKSACRLQLLGVPVHRRLVGQIAIGDIIWCVEVMEIERVDKGSRLIWRAKAKNDVDK